MVWSRFGLMGGIVAGLFHSKKLFECVKTKGA